MEHKDAKNDLQKIRDEAETHEPTLQIASPELTQATNTQEGKHGDPKDVETIPSPKEDDDGWGGGPSEPSGSQPPMPPQSNTPGDASDPPQDGTNTAKLPKAHVFQTPL